MVDFSGAEGAVAVGRKVLGKGDVVGPLRDVTKPGGQPVDAGGAGAQSEKQAGAGGVAKRGLAMGVGEKGAASGELVDVRGLDQRMAAQTADPIILVIDGQEEHVRLLSSGGESGEAP